jgi:hypothetical protein
VSRKNVFWAQRGWNGFEGDVMAKFGCEGSFGVGGSDGMGSGSLVVAQR